jgi:hypothetical protein
MCNVPHPIAHSGGHPAHSAAMHLGMIPNRKNIYTACKALQIDPFLSGLALLHHVIICNEPHPIYHSGGYTAHSAAMHLGMILNRKNVYTSCKALQIDPFYSGLALLHHVMYMQ